MNTYIIKLSLALITSTFLLSSCLKDDLNNPDIPQAGFTMINVYAESDFIIHKADNNFIQTMNNPLPYRGINFVYLYPGNRKLQTIDATNKLLIDSTYNIKDSLLYTSFVFSKMGNKAGQHLVKDSLLSNLNTNAAFRFLNLAQDINAVDLYIGNTKVIDNRSYDGNIMSTDHFKFTAYSSGINKIVAKNNDDTVIAEKELNMNPTMHYSIVLVKNTKENKHEIIVHQQYRN